MKKFKYEAVAKMTIVALMALVAIIYYKSLTASMEQQTPIQTITQVEVEILPAVVETKPAYEATIQEFVCLAMTINGEARNQPISGQIKVAEVVINRLNHGHWGDDICEVVHYVNNGTYHFTTWDPKDPNLKHIMNAFIADEYTEATLTSIWVARHVLKNGVRYLPEDSYNYATFRIDNHWTRKLKFVEQDGDHIFRQGF